MAKRGHERGSKSRRGGHCGHAVLMPGPRLRGSCEQRLSRGPGAFAPQMPNVGGMVGAGETQLYKGTCKFLVTKTGGQVGIGTTSWNAEAKG